MSYVNEGHKPSDWWIFTETRSDWSVWNNHLPQSHETVTGLMSRDLVQKKIFMYLVAGEIIAV